MADTCKWMADNEICCNDKCPMCADFCPVPYEPGVCRYEDRDGAEGDGKDGAADPPSEPEQLSLF